MENTEIKNTSWEIKIVKEQGMDSAHSTFQGMRDDLQIGLAMLLSGYYKAMLDKGLSHEEATADVAYIVARASKIIFDSGTGKINLNDFMELTGNERERLS